MWFLMVSSMAKNLEFFLIDLHVTPENKKHIYSLVTYQVMKLYFS